MAKKAVKEGLKKLLPDRKNKKLIVAAVMALVFLVVCICTFFAVRNYWNIRKSSSFETKLPPDYADKNSMKIPEFIKKRNEVPLAQVKLPIIMYHYIEYVKDRNDKTRISLDINPYNFEQQLKTLKENNYTTYYVRDIPDILSGKIQLASRSAVLTFDDGYQDFYDNALPLLKKYDMKATIYVIYNYIGRRGFLTEDEIRQIVASGRVEIGDHTFDHLSLKNLPTKIATKQVIDSKKAFEDKFGIKIETFAYPSGSFGPETLDLVKEASYSAAVSVIPGNVHSDKTLLYLYRIRAGALLGPNMIQHMERDYVNK